MAEIETGKKKNITIFGVETEFDGVLKFTDRLVITGKFNGKIEAPEGDLEIAKSADCHVDSIKASSIVISGNVEGTIEADERVEICSGSKVKSDITTARFRIASNVDYSGQVKMLEKEPEADLFSVASSEFKQAMIIKADKVS